MFAQRLVVEDIAFTQIHLAPPTYVVRYEGT